MGEVKEDWDLRHGRCQQAGPEKGTEMCMKSRWGCRKSRRWSGCSK